MKRNPSGKSTDKAGNLKRATAAVIRSATCIALLSVPAVQAAGDSFVEREITFKTSDGWQIAGSLSIPNANRKVAGVLLVHGSRHEKDAYGQTLPRMLNEQGIATLRIDIRGRGASRAPLTFNSMAPEQRRTVSLDILAAIDFLASQSGVDSLRIAVVAEQDSANPAVIACAKDRRIAAFVLLSGRLSQKAKGDVAATQFPIFCLVSKEDRRGFKDMTDAYLSSNNRLSRLKVFEGIGFGTTMFSAWQYEFPKEQPIENMISVWLAGRLKEAARAAAHKKSR
jgi:predicted alpha/beta hydrolase